MDNYKVVVISGEKAFEEREMSLKAPGKGEVLLKVDSTAICTLEQRIYNGAMPRYPFAGGHEVAGVIEQIGEGVKGVQVGDKAAVRLLTNCGECHYCRSGNENQCVISFKAMVHEGLNGPGGFAQYMLLNSKTVYKLADDINLEHASLAEPLACCVHSINKGKIQLADDVVIIGAGIMGAFHIMLAKLKGARVIVCEIDEKRLEFAKQLGADVVINSAKVDAIEEVKSLTGERGADAVFCTAALTDLAADAVAMTGKLGRCVLYSSFHPKKPIELDVNNVHYGEMVITGSVNPSIQDFQTAVKLLSSKLIDVSSLVSGVFELKDIDSAMGQAVLPHTYRVIVKMP